MVIHYDSEINWTFFAFMIVRTVKDLTQTVGPNQNYVISPELLLHKIQ